MDKRSRKSRHSIRSASLILAFAASTAPLRAQEAPQPQPALPQSSAPATQQEPSAPSSGAQVQTGSVIGEGNLLLRVMNLLGDHRYPEMERLLNQPAEEGSSNLSSDQKQELRGVLANRENKSAESLRLLEPAVARLDAAGPSATSAEEEKLVRRALAEDYLRLGNWSKAAQAYQNYVTRTGGNLTADERDEIELPLKLLPLVATHPQMTVEAGEPFSLPYDRDELGLSDIPVFVDAQSHDWMLDPTAPFNLICRSSAREIGLRLSEETATVHTITGHPMQVHATIIPRFTIGTVTFRNMTAFVFDDADYFFPASGYQVRGVLGFPAVSALGRLTITANARIEVQPGDKGERLTDGARFFLDGDQTVVALGKPGDERIFVVDAGGQQTFLTSRYYAEHSDDFANKKAQLLALPGSQNKPPAAAYVADAVNLLAGSTPMTFHYMQVLTQPAGNAAIDDNYGTLGLDALDELKSFTFDYRTMRFAVTAH